MQKSLVSIIVPTYNRAHVISETLDSIITQTYKNWECIIVDDGSTDNIQEVIHNYIKKDKRFIFYSRPANTIKGANTCRNIGFKLSKGEYINWFDSDDIMLPNFLKVKLNLFTDDINFVICSGSIVDSNLKLIKTLELSETPVSLYKEYFLWNLKILTPSVLFKKKYLNNKTLFLDFIKRGQETELFSRLFYHSNSNKEYKIINRPLFLYRQHEETKTHQNTKYVREFLSSQIYIYTENLKRAQELKDKYFENKILKSIFYFYCKSLDNKDAINKAISFNSLIKNKGKNLFFFIQIHIFNCISKMIGKTSYKLRKLIDLNFK